MTTTTSPFAFEHTLVTRSPMRVTGRLSHVVSASAPAGIASGLTRPVTVQRSAASTAPSSAMPVRGGTGSDGAALHRSIEFGGRTRTLSAFSGSPTIATPAPSSAMPVWGGTGSDGGAMYRSIEFGDRTRTLAAFSGSPTIATPAPSSGPSGAPRSLVDAPVPAEPYVRALRPVATPESEGAAPATSASAPAAESGADISLVVDVPPQTSSNPSTVEHTTGTERSAAPLPVASSAPPTPRKVGLGAPLHHGRDPLPVQRALDATATADATSESPQRLRPGRLPLVELQGPRQDHDRAGTISTPDAPLLGGQPLDVATRAAEQHPHEQSPDAPHAPGEFPRLVPAPFAFEPPIATRTIGRRLDILAPRVESGGPAADRSTLGLRPLVPAVQRSTEPPPADVVGTVERGTGVDLRGVQVRRDTEAHASTLSMSARAATTPSGEVLLPPHHGPTSSGGGRSLLTHELVHVAQQRSLGAARPAEATSTGRVLEARAEAAERAVTRSHPTTMPVARPLVAAPDAAPEASSPPSGQPDANDSLGSTTVEIGSVMALGTQHEASPSTDAGPQRAPNDERTGASSSARSAADTDPRELDELARRLYDRLRWRLRAELRLDRERAGAVLDIRR